MPWLSESSRRGSRVRRPHTGTDDAHMVSSVPMPCVMEASTYTHHPLFKLPEGSLATVPSRGKNYVVYKIG